MKPVTCVLLVFLSVSTASAQTPSRAELVLTILGGVVSGHSLWDVGKQPVTVVGSSPTAWDTLHVIREISSSAVIGASATYFFSPHVGMHAEISYMGLPFDDSCTDSYVAPADSGRIRAACDDIASKAGSGGAISLFVGATLRAASTKSLSPYVRGNIGIVGTPHSYVEMFGTYFTSSGPQDVPVIKDPSPRSSTPLVGLAVGVTQPLGRDGGYQFRLEFRDAITTFERVTGAADPASQFAPTEIKGYHHFSLTLGLDVVLEKSRGRRY
jgi:hypothetical protein